jgi:hypothetical protein
LHFAFRRCFTKCGPQASVAGLIEFLSMEYERYGVLQVWPQPEKFLIVYITAEGRNGQFLKTSYELTEAELRVELQKLGLTKTEIDLRIEGARKHPI